MFSILHQKELKKFCEASYHWWQIFFSWSAKIDGTKHSLNFTIKFKATVESLVDIPQYSRLLFVPPCWVAYKFAMKVSWTSQLSQSGDWEELCISSTKLSQAVISPGRWSFRCGFYKKCSSASFFFHKWQIQCTSRRVEGVVKEK